jgi:hypothetical protein
MVSWSEGCGDNETKTLPQYEVGDGSSDGTFDAREMRPPPGALALSISQSNFV